MCYLNKMMNGYSEFLERLCNLPRGNDICRKSHKNRTSISAQYPIVECKFSCTCGQPTYVTVTRTVSTALYRLSMRGNKWERYPLSNRSVAGQQ